MTGKPFLTTKSLVVSVKLLPLLSREVAVDRIALEHPVFNLEVDMDGRKSWDFAPPGRQSGIPARLVRLAQAPAPTATDASPQPIDAGQTAPAAAPVSGPTAAAKVAALAEFSLGDVRIENGTVNYADARTGALQQVTAIDLQVGLPAISKPLDAKGNLTWRGERIDVDGQLTSLKSVLEEQPSNIVLKVRGRPLTASYDGAVSFKDALQAEGAAGIKTASLRDLAAWIGATLPPARGFGKFDIAGRVRAAGTAYTISDLTATLDGATAAGTAAIETSGTRPAIKANLKLSELNVNTYLTAAAEAQPAAPASAPAKSIEDLLNDPAQPAAGPQVKGFTQRAGLSDEPLDFSMLAVADADITLESGRVVYQQFAIDRVKLNVKLANKVLKTTLEDVAAYGGRARGFVSIDASSATAAVGANVAFDGVSLVPLAKALDVANLDGAATLGGKIAMAGQGASQRQIADTLAGDTSIAISKGDLRYSTGGAAHQLKVVNVTAGVTSLSGPLTTKGSLVWNGETISVDANLATLKELADEKPVQIDASIAGRPVTATYSGSLSVGDSIAATGVIAAKTASVRTLAKWLGSDLPPARGFGPLDMAGQLDYGASRIALTASKISLDGDTATGDIALDRSGARPAIKTTLNLTGLDLNKYMPKGVTAPNAPAEKPAVGTTGSTTPAKVRGYTQRSGWSEEQIDFAALGLLDVDAKLTLGRLLYNEIKMGQSQVSVGLKNSVLRTNFNSIQLYEGKGKGFISIDGTQPKVANVGANLAFEGVRALTFLKDAADLDWLDGKSKINLAVAGRGASQRQIMDTLNGKADLTFTDGAIVGINIPGMIRSLGSGNLGALKDAPTEKTDFSQLSSTWAIANGVALNQDLQLVSPLLRVTGTGKVAIGQRQIDYLMKPKVVANLTGQGGDQGLSGLEVPLRIHGSWEKPKFTPDLKGILSDPNKVIDQVKEIGKQFKGKDAKDFLKGILGGGQNAAPAAAPQ